MKEGTLNDLNGRKIAIDASMVSDVTSLERPLPCNCLKQGSHTILELFSLSAYRVQAIYQFLVAVRSNDGGGGPSTQLTNEAGEVTSHLQGMWYRTLKFVEAGIKPVYVFDGKPPTLKGGQLAKRKDAKEAATKAMELAQEAGNVEDVERFAKRTVKMEKSHIEDCKKLLKLMGMPVVDAPCEVRRGCVEACTRVDTRERCL